MCLIVVVKQQTIRHDQQELIVLVAPSFQNVVQLLQRVVASLVASHVQVAIELLDANVSQVRASKQVFGLVRQVAARVWIVIAVSGQVLRASMHGLLLDHLARLPHDRARRSHHPEFEESVVHHGLPDGSASQPVL